MLTISRKCRLTYGNVDPARWSTLADFGLERISCGILRNPAELRSLVADRLDVAIGDERVVDAGGKRHLELVFLAAPLQEPCDLVAVDVDDPRRT